MVIDLSQCIYTCTCTMIATCMPTFTITADFLRLFAAFNLKLDVSEPLFPPLLVPLLLDLVQSRLKQRPSFLVQPLLLISLGLCLGRGG